MFTLETIRERALAVGFDDVGITEAKIPQEDIDAYELWLAAGNHAELSYMENRLRCHPEQLLPGARSAIIFVSYYKQSTSTANVAAYAQGRDYHHLHRRRLKKFIRWLEETSGQTGIAKGFSDSTPILEKALAVKAGLGWFGKNTLLIHRRFGTFTLLAGLLTTLELPYSTSNLRLPKCGSCMRCLDACPTQALSPYQLNANRCLSYHTIESKKAIPEEIAKLNPGYVFGCDICQNVCPHNATKPQAPASPLSQQEGHGPLITEDTLESFRKDPTQLFGTPLQRRGLDGLIHTFERISKNRPRQAQAVQPKNGS